MGTEVRPIPGRPGYFCDRLGAVYSDKSGVMRVMKLRLSTRGYLTVALRSDAGGYTYDLVHRLIATTWIGSAAPRAEVNHKNGDKTDNSLANLEWTTRTLNERHARAVLGKDCRGERHVSAKITAADAKEIRRLRAEGWTYPRLAKRFPVGMSQLHRIVSGTKWGHV